MPVAKMHPDEADIDADLVARLLAEQFPQWAGLPLVRVDSTGTDNVMYRVGEHLCARLPRIGGGGIAKEQRWIPALAPSLPLEVPAVVGHGAPGPGYPHAWSVIRWLDGAQARLDLLDDPLAAAEDLAGFLKALQAVDTVGGPRPRSAGSRGAVIRGRDGEVHAALGELAELGADIDTPRVLGMWSRVLATADWAREPVWVHGDLQGGNLLVRDGRLSAVLDFSTLSVGDPAVDLIPAWNFFTGDASRRAFREALGVDDATWERGRGWALSIALVALPYYTRLGTNPRIVADSWHVIDQLLEGPQAAH